MHNGDDFDDVDYPVKWKRYQPANRPLRRETVGFPVDTFDLRIHVLIGYMEKAVRRPLLNRVVYDEIDDSDDDSESDSSSGEETSHDDDDDDDDDDDYTYNKYKNLGCFFTEKDGTQEPYEVCVRFSCSPLSDDDEEKFVERISQETQIESDTAESTKLCWELFQKENENVKKSYLTCLNCFRTTYSDDDEVKETPNPVKRAGPLRKVFSWFQRFQRWIKD
ncbi:WD repeat-containing protein JIP5-like [Pecten maximus]|uniref:WD repeat-containing protein JIP5-like n=1 Tax=Pecten maximus TaxID=6579 RepID=UPI0014588E4F|nr:WD repeat-containing protein JIP5-like [Pecten maximus]